MRIVNYKFVEEKSDEAIELAFNKKLADKRKDWLANYDRNNVLDYTESDVTHEDFIRKELIHFSNSDNKRSLPCLIDGLKVSHRKILFCAFKKNYIKKLEWRNLPVMFLNTVVIITVKHHYREQL